MSEPPLLKARIEYHRKGFALNADFALRSAWTVLFGASGAGKTTILRILSGLTKPSSGAIQLGERTLLDQSRRTAVPSGQRRIGFVPQHAALFPHLTARENIGFGLHRWTRAARESRMDELLTFYDLESLALRKPREISGGERQRVVLAQTVAPNPELLLLDEPFNAIDAPGRAVILDKLRSTGVPVLYVSHDLADAWQTNADAILLEAGKITAQGPARVILATQREQILAQLGASSSDG